MKRFVAIVMLGLRGVMSGSGPSFGAVTSDAEQVTKLQADLVKAYIDHDLAALERILADDYTFTNDRGEVETKGQVLSNFRTGGDRTITSYEIEDPRVRVYGDAAVMIYAYTSREQYQGRDDGGHFRITRVFVRLHGHWTIVAGHETRIVAQ